MVGLTQALEGFQFLLAAVCVLLAIQCRGALAFPAWLYGDSAWNGRAKAGEVARIAAVVVVMLVIQGLPQLVEVAAQRTLFSDAVKQWYLYPAFAATGWIAGRYGGRFGTACALGTVLFPILFLLASVPVGLVLLGSVPQKGASYARIVLLEWYDTVLQAPPALALALAASMAGRNRVRR